MRAPDSPHQLLQSLPCCRQAIVIVALPLALLALNRITAADDGSSEIAELKARLQRVEHLLSGSHRQSGFMPLSDSVVPPPPSHPGDEGITGGSNDSAHRQIQPRPPARNWNLSSVGQMFQKDDYPTVNLSGFLQLDTGWIVQNDENKAAIGDINAQTGLRRVRLRVDGFVREHTGYVIDLDFAASGHPSFRNVALTFGDVPTLQNLILGYFKTPFGMDAMTSGRELLLLERQLPFAFAPFRQTGAGVFGTNEDECSTYNFALFGFPTDSFGVTTTDSGGSFAGRITRLLVYQDGGERLLHVGVGYSLGDPANNTVRYRIQPGFFVTDPVSPDNPVVPTIVDTRDIAARMFHLFNLEVALAIGPVQLQSEARVALVDQIGGPTLGFSGAYVQIGLIVTGERPNYDRRQAIFRRIIPHRDFKLGQRGGAVELTCGYTFIDLDDKNIQGGMAQQFTVGLNWYLHKHTKFVLNFAPATLDDPRFGSSSAVVVSARAQVEF